MAGHKYYLVTSLPSLGDLGTAPPLALSDLREAIAASRGPRALVDALLLSGDLLERDAAMAGEIREVEPAVLTPAQARDEEPLPDYLVPPEEAAAPRIASDAVWGAYFRHAATVAARGGSRLLADWVAHETALRNALATARAKALGLDPAEYLVAPELGAGDADFSVLVADWAAAPDPLEGLKVLDRARWHWLTQREAWFSFGDDELVTYAAKLMLLVRWHRLGT